MKSNWFFEKGFWFIFSLILTLITCYAGWFGTNENGVLNEPTGWYWIIQSLVIFFPLLGFIFQEKLQGWHWLYNNHFVLFFVFIGIPLLVTYFNIENIAVKIF